jgi:glycosyltransferase involved in cell wall biosynthesis
MHETPQGFFHLDQPTPEPQTPAGRVKLAGWAAGSGGRHFVDLRVRLGATLHPVVYGFPRADLAAFFKQSAAFLPGGFEAYIPLAPGIASLEFEALDIAGTWQPLHTATISVGPAGEPLDQRAPVIHPHEFARCLLGTLRSLSDGKIAAAAQTQAAALPLPAVLRFPHLPFRGHLHQPTLTERVLFGRLRIEGWLFHETAQIRRVAASVDLQTWQDLAIGGSKAYVEAMYPQFHHARNCRIDGLIDIPAQLPIPLCVRIYAELEDGTWHLCQVQRVHTWDQETEKQPLPPYRPATFLRSARSLYRACRTRGYAVPRTRAFWQGLRKAHGEYRLRARPACCPASDPAVAGGFSLPDAGTAPTPRRITLFTHNLSREGAPLFLLELAHEYARAGARLHLVAAEDGPLGDRYRELGATVQIMDTSPLQRSASARELQGALANLEIALDLSATDLVVANTLSTWWAVHLAHQAHKPSLFYLHESTTPATFYLGHMAPCTLPLIERTFRMATCASFLTETSRVYYRPWLGRTNHGINPGWIDIAAIDQALAAQSRENVRRDLGVTETTRLVVNVGSVCDRKGQHIFVRGVDLLCRQQPALAASCQFLMIGGRDTLFDRDLQSLLRQLDRANLSVIPATAAPLPYYQAADLFVCSSYEESLPRVIMEAMAARVPILSTAVHGIRDLLPDARHGHLIPPGDSQALCDGLRDILSNLDQATERTGLARARVVRDFNSASLLPRHVALATRVASIQS